MTGVITQIMVEILIIFGIATKELRRGSTSEFRIGQVSIVSKPRVEKLLRRLAGIADVEYALKKLDRLTREEARLALAEVLRFTHNFRDELKAVGDNVEIVRNKVMDIGDKVADMGGRVEDMGDKVEDVSDRVRHLHDKVEDIDEKVQVVINGTRSARRSVSMSCQSFLTSILSDSEQARVSGKETNLIIQQMAGGINEINCSWLRSPITSLFLATRLN